MGKNNRANRVRKQAARARRERGAAVMEPFLGPELDVTPPNEALLGTSSCPVGEECAGCGSHDNLHAVAPAFGGFGDWEIACATLCNSCDGRSFLPLLGPGGLRRAITRHTMHRAAAG